MRLAFIKIRANPCVSAFHCVRQIAEDFMKNLCVLCAAAVNIYRALLAVVSKDLPTMLFGMGAQSGVWVHGGGVAK